MRHKRIALALLLAALFALSACAASASPAPAASGVGLWKQEVSATPGAAIADAGEEATAGGATPGRTGIPKPTAKASDAPERTGIPKPTAGRSANPAGGAQATSATGNSTGGESAGGNTENSTGGESAGGNTENNTGDGSGSSTGGSSTGGGSDSGSSTRPDVPAGSGDAAILRIEGDGVTHSLSLSLSQLQAMTAGHKQVTYSLRNNWPTKSFATASGISIAYLLELCGIKSGAKSIKLIANDGFSVSFTREQLLAPRFYYPNLRSDSEDGAISVPSLLAWEEGSSASNMQACDLHSYVGQCCLTDVNAAVGVQNVATIQVSTADPGRFAAPVVSSQQSGNSVTVTVDTSLPYAKIYYTTDGSTPTRRSTLYNPSTDNFQPQLNAPFTVSTPVTVKFLVAGFGKQDSEVATYRY